MHSLSSPLSRVSIACRYASRRICCRVSLSPFVCHKPMLYRNDWTNRAGFWHGGFLPSTLHCVVRKSLSPKIKNLSLWNFATNRGKSIALSTKLVVVVDCRVCWWHVYDNRVVAVYYKSVNSNVILYFHYFDLLWICCTTCFYVWQDFNGRSASRAASAVACKANAVNLDSYTRLGVFGAWPGC